MGKMVPRGKNGRFVKGHSGHPEGRPKGSKNVITTQKLMIEEAFRGDTQEDVQEVLALVVKQAKEGDKVSQKLVWDASVSKQTLAEDKSAGGRAKINVRTMNVRGTDIEGDFEDVTTQEETLQ